MYLQTEFIQPALSHYDMNFTVLCSLLRRGLSLICLEVELL